MIFCLALICDGLSGEVRFVQTDHFTKDLAQALISCSRNEDPSFFPDHDQWEEILNGSTAATVTLPCLVEQFILVYM